MSTLFADQFAAKAFFVARIVARAVEEHSPLSRAEAYQLNWTEVEPGFDMNSELIPEFELETDADTYEEKVRGLVERAYRTDVAADPSAREKCQAAREVLGDHDHYVLVMIDAAIGKELAPPKKHRWWFW